MTSTVTLDEIVVDWRTSLEAAEDAVQAIVACRSAGVPFAPAELGEYARHLDLQRHEVEKLIEQIAHDGHIALPPLAHGTARHESAAGSAVQTVRGCVFDLDGVLTASTEIHAAAWKDVLDEFACRRSDFAGHRFAARPFGMQDYWEHIHDRPETRGPSRLSRKSRHRPARRPSRRPSRPRHRARPRQLETTLARGPPRT